jgi:hypothetical protein
MAAEHTLNASPMQACCPLAVSAAADAYTIAVAKTTDMGTNNFIAPDD